jgi:hypothetical protein
MWLTVKKYKGKGSVKISSSTECHFYEKYSNNLKIRYDLGLMPLYVYRVSGRGRLPYLFKPVKDFNNQIVYSQIYNIFARSIEEVPLEDFDAALLCIPDEPKILIIEYLLVNQKHVLVEKPLFAANPQTY